MRRYSTIDLPSGVSSASEDQQRALGQFLAAHPRRGVQRAAAAVAEGDGAGLVEQQHVDVAGRLHRATGLGDHVQAHQAVHAGDADGREQAADGGRDQRHQQRHQEHQRQVAAGEQGERLRVTTTSRKIRVRPISRMSSATSLGGLLPLGAFHQGDHPVQGRLARVGADPHQQPVGHHLGVAGHRRAIAAGLADHRRRFAGDGGLVDRRHAFDDFAVAGNHLAGLDPYHVALAQAAGSDALETAVGAPLIGGEALAAGLRLSARALPRPSASASAKLAKSTVNHSQRAICSATEVGTAWSGTKHSKVVSTAVSSTTSITGERSNWRGSSLTKACSSAGRHKAARLVDALWRRSSDFVQGVLGRLGLERSCAIPSRSRGSVVQRSGRGPGSAGRSGRRPAGWSR